MARHQAAVFRFATAVSRDSSEAEDALQETFLAAWRGAASFRGEEARPWLLTIARRAVYRLHRRREGEPSDFVSIEDLGQKAGWGSEDPETEMASLQDRALLRHALSRLPATYREVLVLRELESFSGNEVASMTGLSLAAVKSRLHRARLALTAAVKEEVSGGS